MLKKIVLAISLFLTGCTTTLPPPLPTPLKTREDSISIIRESVNQMPQIICWNNFGMYSDGVKDWLSTSNQRFNNPVIFACHGGVHIEDCIMPDGKPGTRREWWVFPDPPRVPMSTDKLAETLANLYPERDIVIIACNPGAFDLHVKRVWYSKNVVWIVPHAFASGNYFRINEADAVGSIWQFVSYDGRANETTSMVPNPIPNPLPTSQPATKPATRPASQPSH